MYAVECLIDDINVSQGLTANYNYNTGPSSAKFGSYYKYIQSAYSSSYVYRGTLESIEHFDGKFIQTIYKYLRKTISYLT